jgi:hypothetical protein
MERPAIQMAVARPAGVPPSIMSRLSPLVVSKQSAMAAGANRIPGSGMAGRRLMQERRRSAARGIIGG